MDRGEEDGGEEDEWEFERYEEKKEGELSEDEKDEENLIGGGSRTNKDVKKFALDEKVLSEPNNSNFDDDYMSVSFEEFAEQFGKEDEDYYDDELGQICNNDLENLSENRGKS